MEGEVVTALPSYCSVCVLCFAPCSLDSLSFPPTMPHYEFILSRELVSTDLIGKGIWRRCSTDLSVFNSTLSSTFGGVWCFSFLRFSINKLVPELPHSVLNNSHLNVVCHLSFFIVFLLMSLAPLQQKYFYC